MDMTGARKVQSRASAMGFPALTAGTGLPLNVDSLNSLVLARHAKTASPQLASGVHNLLTTEENARFLGLISSCAQVTTHYDLFLLAQSALQFFLPHDILIAAWGDFRTHDPQVDVISNLPGVRTDHLCENVVPLAKRLYDIWMDGNSQPLILDQRAAERHACATRDCALPCSFPGMRFTLVHGTRNKRDGYDSLYIALRRQPFAINGAEARLHFLADAVVHQVDVAYRKVAALRTARAPANERTPYILLSVREKEIAYWVCQGKTNARIAQILGISVNTVKNHVHRIFRKLGANNRTQAVLKCRGVTESAKSNPALSNS